MKQCRCSKWEIDDVIPMIGDIYPETVYSEFQILKKRTPWLDLVRCVICNTQWYIGTDTVDDDFYVLRVNESQVNSILLKDEWPERFDGMYALWPDEGWLKTWEFTSLQDWQEKNKI